MAAGGLLRDAVAAAGGSLLALLRRAVLAVPAALGTVGGFPDGCLELPPPLPPVNTETYFFLEGGA